LIGATSKLRLAWFFASFWRKTWG